VVKSNGVEPGKALQSFRKVGPVRYNSTIDEHGNNAYLPFQCSPDFKDHEVVRIVKFASSSPVCDR
jgi:hypothetical protein